MGCICSKGIPTNEYVNNNARNKKGIKKSSKRVVASSRREEVRVETDATTRLISVQSVEENVDLTPVVSAEVEKKVVVEEGVGVSARGVENSGKPQLQRGQTMDVVVSGRQPQISRVRSLQIGGGEPGWPSWLMAVAGEAIKGWVPRRAESFEKLEKIGQGTYSYVFKARDLETGKIVAMKKVRFTNMDPDSVRFMAREIHILRKLDHPNVMKLEGLVASRVSGSLYLIFEYMEHDLAGLAATPGIKFSEDQIKCYMQQLLCGLEYCHSRGVLHRDIKGSNLLIDNNGNLKIADFGLATFFHANQKQPLTSRVVTLWYRPPELLLGATEYGVAVDLWSAGCILAEFFDGKPIMPGRTEVEQLHMIFKLCGSPSEEYWEKSKLPSVTSFKPQQPYPRCISETFKDFPPSALALVDVLLAIETDARGSASSALQSEFFTTNPLPCDPSTLPKYPPSKEFDARLRDEEARRQRAAERKARKELVIEGSKESKAVPAPDANAELQVSIQKRKGKSNPKSSSEKYNPGEGGSGFPVEASLGPHDGFENSVDPSSSSGFGSSRSMLSTEDEALVGPSWGFSSSFTGTESRVHGGPYNPHKASSQFSRLPSSGAGPSRDSSSNLKWRDNSSEKHEWSHHLLGGTTSSQRKDGRGAEKERMAKKNRIHYSGPLLPSGENIDEMLKEHERQIQQAVRKARIDKTKPTSTSSSTTTTTTTTDNGQTESLLHHQKMPMQ